VENSPKDKVADIYLRKEVPNMIIAMGTARPDDDLAYRGVIYPLRV
jgi:hypothetical protein